MQARLPMGTGLHRTGAMPTEATMEALVVHLLSQASLVSLVNQDSLGNLSHRLFNLCSPYIHL